MVLCGWTRKPRNVILKMDSNRVKQEPEETTVEVRLVEYASIPKAPSHSRNHALEELMGDGLADESPIVVASQCSGSL